MSRNQVSILRNELSLGVLAASLLLITACGGGGGGSSGVRTTKNVSLGMKAVNPTDEDKFRRTFGGSNSVPTAFDWKPCLPPIGDQGRQGSCVGWSTAYYTKTCWEARAEGWSTATTDHQFSPAFVYNQINGGKDGGSIPSDSFTLMSNSGCSTLATMPYSDTDFLTQPNATAMTEAANFKNQDLREYATFDFNGFVTYLATTGPIVFGIQVYDNFMNLTGNVDYTAIGGQARGGHAIACVGYDLNRNGGSLLLANSWNTTWGNNGFAYVSMAAMQQIFLGAWTMVDGPNTGGGGGGTHEAPTLTANSWNSLVELEWTSLAWAAKFRLEKSDDGGTSFQQVAEFPADTFFFQDLAVSPSTTYDYRLAGVDETGAPGDFANVTVTTDSGGGGGGTCTLTASDPDSGTAFPDSIALDWTLIAGNHVYAVFRSASEEGFRNGNYDLIAIGEDASSYVDYVSPGDVFQYLVAVADPATLQIEIFSNTDLGATSGAAGGADLGILDAGADLTVTPGTTASGGVQIFNYASSDSPNQWVVAGLEYYLIDGSWGILWYSDDPNGTVAIFAAASGNAITSQTDVSYSLSGINVPVYLNSDESQAIHYWFFHTDPLDGSGNLVQDIFPWDNDFWTFDYITVN